MKKVYEEPSVKKVEFEFNERIAASGSCSVSDPMAQMMFGNPDCKD